MNKSREGNISADHSDSDDWTLLSPPQSTSSSPQREPKPTSEPKLESLHSNSSSSLSLEQTVEDGLLEIDLNETNETPSEVNSFSDKETQVQDYSGDESHLSENDDTPEYKLCVLRKRILASHENYAKDKELVSTVSEQQSSECPQTTATALANPARNLSRLSVMRTNSSRSSPAPNHGMSDPLMSLFAGGLALIVTLIVFFICLIALIPIEYISDTSPEKVCYKYVGPVDRLGPEDGMLPEQHHFEELKALHTDLSNCIRRQNPTSFTYYISPERTLKASRPPVDIKPYRGLVCYEQEAKWRKRMKRLKSEYGIDLISLTQEVKRRVTNEIVQLRGNSGTTSDKQSQLDLNLILNQIEYLDYIERERNKRRLEENLKHATAENMQLVRRLKRPSSETANQRPFASVELENVRLQRENAKLKASLMEKVGPIYMKQALELEAFERENTALKKFYHQVAQDVARSLKQFNLHIVNTPNVIDDDENLNAQLMLTRGYLRRLSEKISTVLIENEGLKDELKDIYLMSMHNKANLPAIKTESQGDKSDKDKNGTNVLVADSCLRSLMESREKSSRLEQELESMRRNCSNRNVDLERSRERLMHRPGDDLSVEQHPNMRLTSTGRTDLDKRASDISSMRTEEMVDELILFLTKFNNQIESKGLAKVEDSSPLLQAIESESDVKKGQTDNSKVIPIYIREAIRSVKNGLSDRKQNSPTSSQASSESHIKLPMTPPSMYKQSTPTTSKINVSRSCLDATAAFKDTSIDLQDAYGVYDNNHNVTSESSASVESLNDSWFFKRAKQRKDLRRHDKPLPADYQADWLTKRAKLREKLRKASTYIDNYYRSSSSHHTEQLNKGHSLPHNQQKSSYDYAQHDKKQNRHHHKCNGGDKKQHKGTTKQFTGKRNQRQKYVRDEL